MLLFFFLSFFFFFIVLFFFFRFFFSSRRRHTRCLSDWSSECALPIFDVLALRADGALESVTAFLALVRGPANGSRQLWFGRGREVRVEVLEGPSAPVQLDGEVTGETPFQVRLVPGALRVLVDPATASQRRDRRG